MQKKKKQKTQPSYNLNEKFCGRYLGWHFICTGFSLQKTPKVFTYLFIFKSFSVINDYLKTNLELLFSCHLVAEGFISVLEGGLSGTTVSCSIITILSS